MRREARTPIHGNETVASPLSVRPLCVRQVIYEVAEGTVIFYLFQIISSAIYLFNQRVGMDGYFIQVHPDHKLTCAHTHSHTHSHIVHGHGHVSVSAERIGAGCGPPYRSVSASVFSHGLCHLLAIRLISATCKSNRFHPVHYIFMAAI